MFDKKFFSAVAILVGTVIGAGIFALPYAVAKIGFIPGLFYLIALALVVFIVNCCYAETTLRTGQHFRMAGYADKYLGPWGRRLLALSLILGIFGALIAYIIGVGNFLAAILGPYLGGTAFIYSLIFWLIASLVVLKGLGIIERVELFMVTLLLFVTFYIVGTSLPRVWQCPAKLLTSHPENIFFPYGVILFALGGATAIPTMKRTLKNKLGLLKKAIIIGVVIPVIVYILFTLAIVGVTGENTSQEAIIGLGKVLGTRVLLIGGIFGVLAMTTSYLALGFVLRQMFHIDYKAPLIWAWLLTCLIPLAIFLAGAQNFVQILGISGSILGGFQGILLIMMYYRAKKMGDRQPEFKFKLSRPMAWFLYLIFGLGVIYSVVYYI